MSYLNSLWASDSIAPNITKLCIATTIANLPAFMEPLTRAATVLSRLGDTEVTFARTRSHLTFAQYVDARVALENFLQALSSTITSLTFTIHLRMGYPNLIFKAFPYLPRLQRFKIVANFNSCSIRPTEAFNYVLEKHASYLEDLVINHLPDLPASPGSSEEKFLEWLCRNIINSNGKSDTFPVLTFPKLQTLEIGVREGCTPKNIFPNLPAITPNLASLILTGRALCYHRVQELVATLAKGDGICALKDLSFVATRILCTDLLDLLAGNLPQLHSLHVHFPEIPESEIHYPQHLSTTRRYPTWKLQSLRITAESSCGTPHPNRLAMMSFAHILPEDVVIDADFRCRCNASPYD
ncbi:hypothetical protein B0H34DRAFT_109979 [Crassisporium funariophilum]|nr:hypothetical protein B0H34DRAFT_109979 [Crassisporium funariophilum]